MERKVKEEQRIERAAHLFAEQNATIEGPKMKLKQGYIAGATKEAERNKEDAIGFAEWLAPNGWVKGSKDDNVWVKKIGSEKATTEQLYEIYINQKV